MQARIIKMGGARPATLPAPIDEEKAELTKIGKPAEEEEENPWEIEADEIHVPLVENDSFKGSDGDRLAEKSVRSAVCSGMAASCNVKLHWIVGEWRAAR